MNMKSTKTWLMLLGILMMAVTCITDAWANTTTVDGIEWTYTVTNNEASLGGGYGIPAVPTSTSGAITIPSTLDGYRVTSVGRFAFFGCNWLESVMLGEDVATIRDYAFYGCSGLTNVMLPDGVENIGNLSFSGCSNLTSVTIPDAVTNIGYSAFSCCTGLESASMGGNVTSIGNHAFWGCSRLTDLTIGSGVTRIGYSVFYGCKKLAKIQVADGNSAYAGQDGMLFSKDMTKLVCCPPGKAGTCIIPKDVASIAMEARFGCAFAGCTRLTAFEVADGNTAYVCRDGVLYSKDMETLVCCPGGKPGVCLIPDGVKSIGLCAFSWCSILKSVSVPASLQSIGDYAFYFCSGLDTLIMPLSWQGRELKNARIRPGCRIIYGTPESETVDGTEWNFVIQNGAAAVFASGGGGAVVIPDQLGGCPVTEIAPSAFWGCEELTDVEIPAGVTEIGDYAFFGCKGLTNVVIPVSVKRIGQHAFHGCTGLTDLSIGSGVEDIGQHAFSKCTGLARMTIPGGVRTIGNSAFLKCAGLLDLVLANGVQHIGSLAFAGCDGLESVTIPASVAELGDHPFANCKGLLEIGVAPGNGGFESQDGVLYSKGKKALLGVPAGRSGVFALPDEVEEIGGHAFDGCEGLTALEVGEGNAHFASRDGVLFSKDMARLLVCPAGKAGAFAVPEDVERIEDRAFADCQKLTRILFPESVTNMGTNSLYRCDGLVALFVPAAWENEGGWKKTARLQAGLEIIHCKLEFETVDDVEWHFFVENGGAVVLPGDYGADVELPAMLGGHPVTKIGDFAFYGCRELAAVAIPGCVTNIGEYAFYGCESLEGVSLPDSVRDIGKWAFGGCKGLKSISIPEGVTHIGDRAFFGCSGLPEAAIPNSVKSIGVNAFYGNSELTALEVGGSNAAYASQDGVLFSKNMEKLLWCPDGKTGEYAIPDTVKTLAYRAFGDCIGLTAGTLPESVEKIGRNAFYGCRMLSVLYVPASWEGEPGWLEMLARAKLPPECRIVYLKDNPEETTSTTPVPVPFEWLEANVGAILKENGGDYEAAAWMKASNDMAVWTCYLIGLDPGLEDAAFTVKLEFVDGKPVVKWDPDLNKGGEKTERTYRVWGKKDIMDEDWTDMTDVEDLKAGGWRFFRVGVDLAK